MMGNQTLIILTPAFPGNDTDEQSPWVPAKQALVRSINRMYPELEVIILSFQFPANQTEYRWNGNRVIPFGGQNKRRGHHIFLWHRVFRQMQKLRKTNNLMGIISFWCAEACLVGSYFSRIYKTPHLCWISGLDASKNNKFVKRIRPRAGELAAMSDFLAAEFEKNHGIKPEFLIPDAIDTSLFKGLAKTEKTIAIIGAGNLTSLKQYNLFIDVLAALNTSIPGINAVLCGSGEEEASLKLQATQSGLADQLTFTGLISQKEVLKFMTKAKILLHPSSYEGFGNVCIEALYAGAHVISFTKPMQQHIPHWHTVATKAKMISTALKILNDTRTEYTPVLPFNMDNSAQKFIEILSISLTESRYRSI